jgi:hypothetical protein
MRIAHSILIVCLAFAALAGGALIYAIFVGQVRIGRGFIRVTVTRQGNPLWYWLIVLLYAYVIGVLLLKLPPMIAATGN